MIFSVYYWCKQRVFREDFQTKVIDLIEMHILCCITFYRKDDGLAKKDSRSSEIMMFSRQK